MSTITLIPSGTDTTTALGFLTGRWNADGTDNPVGSFAWLKPANGAPDLTWQMANTTAGQWLVTSQTLTAADWDASPIPVDADGYKRIPLRIINPTWSTPAAGDRIDFQTQAASGWDIRTGTVAAGRYDLIVVPEFEGWGVVAALAFVAVGRFLKREH